MAGYAKLYSTITESSLWSSSKEVKILFVTMLAKADSTGFIECSLPGLARLAHLSIEETEEALQTLTAPDRYSKNESNEGRRVVKTEGGWCLINYESYRERRSEEDRREYMREYMREYRQSGKQEKLTEVYSKQIVNTVSRRKPQLAQAEAEAAPEASASANPEAEDIAASAACSESAKRRSKPATVETVGKPFDCAGKLNSDGTLPQWSMPLAMYEQLQIAYPAVPVDAELRKVKAWLAANPTKKKTAKGMPRFINSWFSRAQDDAGKAVGNRSSANDDPYGAKHAVATFIAQQAAEEQPQ